MKLEGLKQLCVKKGCTLEYVMKNVGLAEGEPPTKEQVKQIGDILGVTPTVLALFMIERDDAAPDRRVIYDILIESIRNEILEE